jgi:diguanylate cyclase (GGDEF)-like protein
MDRKKSLFFIDQDVILAAELKKFLGTFGIEVHCFDEVGNIEAAIRERKPQAVVLDAVLLGVSGAEVLQGVKGCEPYLPVIVAADPNNYSLGLELLRHGAYGLLRKPFAALEEVYHSVNNAMSHYAERLETRQLTVEMEKRYEYDKLNLLELEFVKSLQHMIGETEEPVAVFKNSYTLMKNFLRFDVFAVLIPHGEETEIHVYPNVPFNQTAAEFIPDTLLKRMTRVSQAEKQVRVVLNGRVGPGDGHPEDYKSVIVALATRERVQGYAGMYRSQPFSYYEESVFKRFSSHIALTLEKISLFNEVRALSINDGLTGIPNHLFVLLRLEEEIARCVRYGSNLSIIMFDIDDFKEVNDAHGHLAGDAVLKRVAQVFKAGIRSIDTVGRYGGEEFLVILPETDGDAAKMIAERLRSRAQEDECDYEGKSIRLTISGGVASFREGMDANRLIKTADEHLYRSKKKGKNMVSYSGAK